jgi:ubiquitin C-terminal hydrolase
LKEEPPILIFQINRVEFSIRTSLRSKNNTLFDFPEKINLGEFLLLNKKGNLGNYKKDKGFSEYKLTGIINHSGSANCGHFFSFIKVFGKWYCLNDSRVEEWDFEQVLNQAKGLNGSSSNAYCLFYAKGIFFLGF